MLLHNSPLPDFTGRDRQPLPSDPVCDPGPGNCFASIDGSAPLICHTPGLTRSYHICTGPLKSAARRQPRTLAALNLPLKAKPPLAGHKGELVAPTRSPPCEPGASCSSRLIYASPTTGSRHPSLSTRTDELLLPPHVIHGGAPAYLHAAHPRVVSSCTTAIALPPSLLAHLSGVYETLCGTLLLWIFNCQVLCSNYIDLCSRGDSIHKCHVFGYIHVRVTWCYTEAPAPQLSLPAHATTPRLGNAPVPQPGSQSGSDLNSDNESDDSEPGEFPAFDKRRIKAREKRREERRISTTRPRTQHQRKHDNNLNRGSLADIHLDHQPIVTQAIEIYTAMSARNTNTQKLFVKLIHQLVPTYYGFSHQPGEQIAETNRLNCTELLRNGRFLAVNHTLPEILGPYLCPLFFTVIKTYCFESKNAIGTRAAGRWTSVSLQFLAFLATAAQHCLLEWRSGECLKVPFSVKNNEGRYLGHLEKLKKLEVEGRTVMDIYRKTLVERAQKAPSTQVDDQTTGVPDNIIKDWATQYDVTSSNLARQFEEQEIQSGSWRFTSSICVVTLVGTPQFFCIFYYFYQPCTITFYVT
ncbi:hypothetical protein BDV93DRAFT_504117 [Ceratobasidium sp. AG-I]|nr:hypothetical protein BDV93DRAFT_504117 [Ceratobasidium sp. AG-I]